MPCQITISTDFDDINLTLVHKFLSNSYWAKNIPLSTLKKALRNSLCFSIFDQGMNQIGFARMITDRATYAYLADVFVMDEYQGQGIGKQLMKTILDHPDLQGLRRIVLATSDAHGLYKQFGFKTLATPEIFMELWKSDIYSRVS